MLNTALALPCGTTLQNRLAKSALTERLSRADYLPNELHRRLYRKWSEQGPGLLITGNVVVDKRYLESAGNVAVEDNSALPALREWTSAGKKKGSTSGRRSATRGGNAPFSSPCARWRLRR